MRHCDNMTINTYSNMAEILSTFKSKGKQPKHKAHFCIFIWFPFVIINKTCLDIYHVWSHPHWRFFNLCIEFICYVSNQILLIIFFSDHPWKMNKMKSYFDGATRLQMQFVMFFFCFFFFHPLTKTPKTKWRL